MNDVSPLKILVTGAYGLIGNLVYGHLAAQPERYDVYGSSRTQKPSQRTEGIDFCPIPPEKLRQADMADFEAVQRAVEGIHTIVHMAADPSGAQGFDTILHSNIIGGYYLFEAARLAGVHRVIYASTNQVVFGYGTEEPYRSRLRANFDTPQAQTAAPILHTQPTRPMNLYACSKVWGEGLAHMYAYQHGLSCLVLRIGWVVAEDKPRGPWARTVWCSQRDVIQLVERCIEAPESLRFDIFFGHSDNQYNLVDIQHARDILGYAPQDSAEERLK
jgi:NAD+ dependent glucose-6-phosphate dehydrogenase